MHILYGFKLTACSLPIARGPTRAQIMYTSAQISFQNTNQFSKIICNSHHAVFNYTKSVIKTQNHRNASYESIKLFPLSVMSSLVASQLFNAPPISQVLISLQCSG